MEAHFDKEAFKEKKRAELSALYDMVSDEASLIAENPERLLEYFKMQARFDRYSVSNAILLMHQFPEARQLKTFEEWKKAGAAVGRYEKSISILEPLEYVKSDGHSGRTYRVRKVFDVSQTDVRQSPRSFLAGVSTRSLLKVLIEASPLQIEASDRLCQHASYNREEQKIVMKRGLLPDEFFRAAAVAVSQAQLDLFSKGVLTPEEMQQKAESAAILLCMKYGVSMGNLRPQLSEGISTADSKEIKAELSKIRKTFCEVTDLMDASIRAQKKEKEAERGRNEER